MRWWWHQIGSEVMLIVDLQDVHISIARQQFYYFDGWRLLQLRFGVDLQIEEMQFPGTIRPRFF